MRKRCSNSSSNRNSNKNFIRREVVRNQKILLGSVIFVLAAVTICSIALGAINTQAAPAEQNYKYYTSVEIHSGDTLWSIASDYITDDYEDMDEYIKEVCEINHISGNEIHSGQYITIPYYSNIIME